MKLPKSAGCLLPADGGNVKEQTMIVEVQWKVFWTWVRFPSAPRMRMGLLQSKDFLQYMEEPYRALKPYVVCDLSFAAAPFFKLTFRNQDDVL